MYLKLNLNAESKILTSRLPNGFLNWKRKKYKRIIFVTKIQYLKQNWLNKKKNKKYHIKQKNPLILGDFYLTRLCMFEYAVRTDAGI